MNRYLKNDMLVTLPGTLILRCAYVLLAIPCLMFFLFYLRPWVGIGLSVVFCVMFGRILSTVRSDRNLDISVHALALFAVLIVLWCAASGLGGLVPQKHDYLWRNPMFHDLIHCSWPVIVNVDGQPHTFVYYFTFWLPPALVGKCFSLFDDALGTFAGNMALLFWGSSYVFVVFLLLALKIRPSGMRGLLTLVGVFVFFSGMDAVGWILYCLISDSGWASLFPCHIELWSNHWQYPSMAAQLGWVPNQALPAWLATAVFLNERSWRRMVFCVALLFASGPFPSVGLGALVLVFGFTKREEWQGALAKPLDTLSTLLCALIVVMVFCFFFKLNTRVNSDVLPRFGTRIDSVEAVCMYGSFTMLEFGILAVLLYRRNCKDWLYRSVVTSLAVLPLFFVIAKYDWTMRVCIPALFVLMVYALDGVLSSGVGPSPIKRPALIGVLCIGSITGICEYVETFAYDHPKFVHPWNDTKPRCEDMDGEMLRRWCKTALPPLKDCEQGFFFRYFVMDPRRGHEESDLLSGKIKEN